MESSLREQLTTDLSLRREAIVDAWFDAVVRTCYIPLSPQALHQHLGELLDRVIALWLAGTPPDDEARRVARGIGADLASIHLVNADALGQTLHVLTTSLWPGSPTDTLEACHLHLRLSSLLQGLATGYYQQGITLILNEQEQIRSALVAELRAADASLQTAHDDLEARVAQRTTELARANAELRKEVAERRRVEQELCESKERWRSLVENAPDLVGTVDREGRIQFLNRLPPGSSVDVEWALGSDGISYAAGSYQDELRRIISDVFNTGARVTREIAFTTLSGTTTWYAVSFGPIWENNEVVEVLFISRNIDHRKKLEQVKDNLIHDVSHELRTPLAKIRMSLEVLSETATKDAPNMERVGHLSRLATTSVDHLIDTVESILDLSRLEAGMWRYASARLDMTFLLELVADEMAPVAQAKGLSLVTQVPVDLPWVVGDKDKLRRVFVNLLDNACKFSDQGVVTLSAGYEDGLVHVAVADEGEGVLPENREHVFERFFQEKTRSHGVGIGLAICKAIVDAHGGRIWVESQGRNQGATFHLLLPAAAEEDET